MYDIQLQPFDMASDFMFGERKRASSPLILVLENWWLKKCSSTIQPHTHTYTSIRYCCVSNWDSSSYSLQVHHGPAGAPGGDPPPHPGPHFRSDNHHHTHHLPLPPQADSQSAPAPQRPLHVQEHVVPQPPSPPSQSHHDRRHFLRAPPPPPRPPTPQRTFVPTLDRVLDPRAANTELSIWSFPAVEARLNGTAGNAQTDRTIRSQKNRKRRHSSFCVHHLFCS